MRPFAANKFAIRALAALACVLARRRLRPPPTIPTASSR